MGMMETIIFGMLAFTTVIAALVSLIDRHHFVSISMSGSTIVFVFLSGYHWRLALVDSGKDSAWLGFRQYPVALIVLSIFTVTAIIIMSINIYSIKRLLRLIELQIIAGGQKV